MQDSQNYELDPNFAVVCSFLERFGKHIGDNFARLTIGDLKAFLEAKRGEIVKVTASVFQGRQLAGSQHNFPLPVITAEKKHHFFLFCRYCKVFNLSTASHIC